MLPDEDIIFPKRAEAQAVNLRTKQPVKPTNLGDQPLALAPDDDPREALADWMSSPKNPFFAKALVNRYWKHFFNRGLVEPEDDMRETNPPANPELLDALAESFIKSGYDLKQLVRTICTSTTYQLSAVPNEYNAVDQQNFSRYYPKRLQAEVLLDAINAVLDSKSNFEGMPAGTRAVHCRTTASMPRATSSPSSAGPKAPAPANASARRRAASRRACISSIPLTSRRSSPMTRDAPPCSPRTRVAATKDASRRPISGSPAGSRVRISCRSASITSRSAPRTRRALRPRRRSVRRMRTSSGR